MTKYTSQEVRKKNLKKSRRKNEDETDINETYNKHKIGLTKPKVGS